MEANAFEGKVENHRMLVEALRSIENMIDSRLKEDSKLNDKEIQLAVYNGNGEYYLRHKDAFRLDSNNIQDGQKMRKYTAIVYLNPDLESIKQTNPKAQLGELRLYLPDKIVDVMPHLGRVIIFKSEIIEHEVRPT